MFQKYPTYCRDISLRLSSQGSRFMKLGKPRKTEIKGSGVEFLKRFDGQHSAEEICVAVANQYGQSLELIKDDFKQLYEELVHSELIYLSDSKCDSYFDFSLKIISAEIKSSVHFDITDVCNEKCVHCLADKNARTPSFDEIIKIVESAAQSGFTDFSISGGEPSLHPDFWKIITTVRRYGFNFVLFTNGISFSLDDIVKLKNLSPEKIRISLYSMKPDIHDAITQVKGSFDRTMASIMQMKQIGLNVFINCPVMNVNYADYRKVADFCFENSFEHNFDPVIQPTRDLRETNSCLQLTYNEAKDVTSFQQSAPVLVANVKDGLPVCNCGTDISVDASLNVYPCPGLRKSIGNFANEQLDTILKSPIIQDVMNLSLSDLPECQTCAFIDGCYRCHGHAYQEHQDYRACSSLDKRQAQIRRELMIERGTLPSESDD